MKVTVSVPGKINLMGEHAIVYGKPSLLTAVNLRLYVSVEDIKEKGKRKKEKLIIRTTEHDDYIRHAIVVVKQELKIDKLPSMQITVTSQIPAGFHLGSSAAVAVATVATLSYFLKKVWNPEQINKIAYEIEKKQHGNPSGGDNTAVTFGGFLWYRKELEFLKSMWQLPMKLPDTLNHFFLINTGRPKETTGEMVTYVNAKCQMSNAKYKTLFDKNEEQTKRIAVAIKEGNENELVDSIRVGERTLEDMGVVSRKVIPLIREIEGISGAGKILGGGGKARGVGFLLCYHHEPKKIEALCKPFGYSIQHIALGEEGVRLEKK